jgi:hypothetical protein
VYTEEYYASSLVLYKSSNTWGYQSLEEARKDPSLKALGGKMTIYIWISDF